MTMPGGPMDATRNVNVVLNAPVQGYVAGITQAEVTTNGFASAVDRLDARLSGLRARASKKLIHFSESDFAALGGATATAATFQKQLGTLNAEAVVTQTSMGGIKGSVENAFSKFPIARSTVIGLTEAISGLGVTGARDLGSLTQTFIKLGAASGEPMSDLAAGLVQLSRLMGTTGSQQIGNYANSLLTVSKDAGVSATSVLSFAQAIAPLARQAGIGEAAVLGISTAFSKAGADGYIAANTFNSIVGDITQLTQSGSPELAKYANLIGVTVDQFHKMDKTTAIEKIFTTIAQQGPRAITTLNQLGIDGTRAQSAIAGVVQSGNLQQSIDQAMGSSHDQKNLNAGSRAAFNNLADSLAGLRNNFTQFGTEVGTSFLRPIDAATHSVNILFAAVNQLVKPFAPLIAVLGEAAGVVGAVGGVAIGAAGLIGTAALARSALRSGPARGLREGIAAGRGMPAGETAAETSARVGAANQSAARYAAGTLPLRARLPYQAGLYYGQQRGPVAPGSNDPGLFRQGARALIRSPFRVGAYLATSQATYLADASRNDYQRSVYQRALGGAAQGSSLRANIAAAAEENRLNAARLSTTRAVIAETGRFGAALAGLTAETAKAGLSMAGGALGRGVARGGSALTSALFSPTALIALPVGLELFSKMRSSLAQGQAQDTADLNPITKYNDALGIATTNLATFSAAVNTAATGTSNLNGVTAASSISSVAVDTRSDIQAVQGQKSSDSTITALAKSRGGSGNTLALQQLAMSYNLTDPRQVQLFKNNANAAGFGQGTVTDALTAAVRAQGGSGTGTDPLAIADYSAVAKAVQGTEGRSSGLGRLAGASVINNQSKSGEALRDSVLSGIGTTANDNQRYGSDFAAQKKFADQLAYFGSYSGNFAGTVRGGKDNAEKVRRKELANALATTYQGKQEDYQQALDKIDFTGMTDRQRQQAIVGVIGATSQGRAQLGTLSTTDVSKMPGVLRSLYGAGQTSATNQAIQGIGPLGRFAVASPVVQGATQNVGNANASYAGSLALAGSAMRSSGSFTGAIEALDKLKGAIQDVNNPLYQMADAARSYVAQQQQYQLPTLSRAGSTRALGEQYRGARANFTRSAAANGGTASPDASAELTSAQQGYQQNKEAQRQYLVSTLQAAQNYGIQMQRAQADQDKTIFRQHRDFQISMVQSEQDYQKQVYRSQRDFGIQLARQAQSSAESIYDPFTRVSAQYTADAGTTVQNLEDQNQRIAQQLHQLQQLKDAGVSQQAIDTLQLGDPGKAQQVSNLVSSLAQNPQLIREINAQVATRVQATGKLTQSSFSETFRNTVSDFARQLADTGKDYQVAHERAAQAQARSLSDMATDYRTMVRRSGDDLKLAMTEIYGSFGDIFARTMAQVSHSVGRYAPQAAREIQSQLDKLRSANPDLFDPNYAGNALPGTVGGKDTRGRTIVADAVVGPLDASKYVRLRDAAHAMGGISTIAHKADISEGNRAEAIIPLDERGLQFMSGFANQVSMAMLRQMRTAQYPSFHTGAAPASGSNHYDLSTTFTGPITIAANDVAGIKAGLAREARLRKLRSPTAATAGSALS